MKKYIILLSCTLLVLTLIFGIDEYLDYRRETLHEIKSKISIEKNVQAEQPKVEYVKPNKVPVLMYHSIGYGQNNLYVSPEKFRQQIEYLVKSGYSFITFEDLLKGETPANPIILTFDDGYDNIYTEVYPLLKQYKIKATVYVIIDNIGKRGFLSRQNIISTNNYISYQSHTLSHTDLRLLDEQSLRKELEKSRQSLQDIASNKVISISYPSGEFNKNIEGIASEYYQYAVTTKIGLYYPNKNRSSSIPRIRVSRKDTVESLGAMIDK